jgi:hypothetical protein
MRGGAIPLFAFGTLLLVLFIGNWIWDPHGLDPLAAGVGALLVYGTAVAIVLRDGRHAVRRGPPEPVTAPETVPQASFGAAIAGFGVASFAFGFTFGNFLIYFGIALSVVGIGRMLVERRAERRTRARLEEARR